MRIYASFMPEVDELGHGLSYKTEYIMKHYNQMREEVGGERNEL